MTGIRRKVVVAYQQMHCFNTYRCMLSCGHSAIAYGRRKRGEALQSAPETCECRRCVEAIRGKAANIAQKGGAA